MNLRDQLKVEEGCVLHAYYDTAPQRYLTIGYGRLIDGRNGGGITQEEAEYLLDNDIRRVTAAVLDALPWAADLSEPRQAVLIGMAFQMGLDGLLKFKNTLSYAEEGRFSDAAAKMLVSVWAKQTPARARRLADQMQTGQWPETETEP